MQSPSSKRRAPGDAGARGGADRQATEAAVIAPTRPTGTRRARSAIKAHKLLVEAVGRGDRAEADVVVLARRAAHS